MTENQENTQQSAKYHAEVKSGKDHVMHIKQVFDYAFEREEEFVNLTFSVRDPQFSSITVRLFECPAHFSLQQREKFIVECIEKTGDNGFEKSGRFYQVVSGDTPESISGKFGYKNFNTIFSHYANELIRVKREKSDNITAGDIIYIPQLKTDSKAIPLGEKIDVVETDESVPRGKRYKAVWDVTKTGFDPLDWDNWIPELPKPGARMPDPGGKNKYILPQFAVFAGNNLAGVSPNPLELIQDLSLNAAEEGGYSRVVLAGGLSREIKKDSSSEKFSQDEHPIAIYLG
ncbi:MAG: LysM peptidoglycan-binding domain-containing protein [Deltaproteobacteria bacterium]|nr:LysM peptidoglycan-binding domain-containing protein [Deltaproteobacteria bacterium]